MERVSYCSWRFLPIFSRARGGGSDSGSIQHSSFAQGWVLTTSGGSTPILRQRNSAAETVSN
jgi:hypothetical protein